MTTFMHAEKNQPCFYRMRTYLQVGTQIFNEADQGCDVHNYNFSFEVFACQKLQTFTLC